MSDEIIWVECPECGNEEECGPGDEVRCTSCGCYFESGEC